MTTPEPGTDTYFADLIERLKVALGLVWADELDDCTGYRLTLKAEQELGE